MEEKTKKAFLWVTDILEAHSVPYRVSGGLAARVHGSDRPLADIDIEIEKKDFSKIFEATKLFAIAEPAQYKDDEWDVFLMTLDYAGQLVDIADVRARIWNSETKEWEGKSGSLRDVIDKEIFGKVVPVEPLESVISYKKKLNREVDREDVKRLKDL